MIIGRCSKQYVTSLSDLDCLCIYLLIICYIPGPLLVCAYSSSDYVTSLVLVLLVCAYLCGEYVTPLLWPWLSVHISMFYGVVVVNNMLHPWPTLLVCAYSYGGYSYWWYVTSLVTCLSVHIAVEYVTSLVPPFLVIFFGVNTLIVCAYFYVLRCTFFLWALSVIFYQIIRKF